MKILNWIAIILGATILIGWIWNGLIFIIGTENKPTTKFESYRSGFGSGTGNGYGNSDDWFNSQHKEHG